MNQLLLSQHYPSTPDPLRSTSTGLLTTPKPDSEESVVLIAVIVIATVYPFAMFICLCGYRKCLVSHGPYRGMTEEQILVLDYRERLRLNRAWCRQLCASCLAKDVQPLESGVTSERHDVMTASQEVTLGGGVSDVIDRPPAYEVALDMAKPPEHHRRAKVVESVCERYEITEGISLGPGGGASLGTGGGAGLGPDREENLGTSIEEAVESVSPPRYEDLPVYDYV